MKARHEFNSEKEWLEYLRTYASVAAMQGIFANSYRQNESATWLEMGVFHAVDIADTLISELNKPKQ